MDDIKCLTNDELSMTLKNLGLKYGPITRATRGVFEKILRSHYRDINQDSTDGSVLPENKTNENCSDGSGRKMVQESQDAFNEETNGNRVFYGVCTERLDNEHNNGDVRNELVFVSQNDAIKAMKNLQGARMKMFNTRDEAVKFSKSKALKTSTNDSFSNISEPSNPYKTPTTQELGSFRTEVEEGNLEAIEKYIKENPKFLVTTFETPVVLKQSARYNVMHVAAKANQVEVCKLVVNILEDAQFWSMMFPDEVDPLANEHRSQRLLDSYVNIPEKGAGETPLHIACKFGFTEVVQFLSSLPYLKTDRKNNFDETAEQVICSRCTENVDAKRKEITEVLSAKYYITLLRAEDDSKDPVLCPPFSKESNPMSPENLRIRGSSPLEPNVQVKACAGPMSPDQARNFFKVWKKSPKNGKQGQFHNDFEKGKERTGRTLAKSFGVPWTEYWSFLGCSVDLSSKSGLQNLEKYFKRKAISRKTMSARTLSRRASNSTSNNRGYFSNQSIGTAGNISTEHTIRTFDNEKTDVIAKNLLDDFNGRCEGISGIGTVKESAANSSLNVPRSDSDVEDLVTSLERTSLDTEIPPNGVSECFANNPTPSDAKKLSANSVSEYDVTDVRHYDSQNTSNVFEDSAECLKVIQGHSSLSQSQNHVPEIPRSFFISGDQPSKLDFDVYRAIEGVKFSADDYPMVYQWKQSICAYSIKERSSWPSPCSPRYRSRLAKMPSADSQFS